ncbi:pentapeptide repeat-containing protein [Shewanella amazonensis]|uniref:Pentapeptide repeat n=1 Tax=Shewanella amazonensis (strain ATCC BAA-1098 / SB2B) TaxID=326297 RepID=A1SBP7_SHEAM|nr:pentapeptide repeat-containing protein [Shewanella amazonensis]ABM01804.1 pentapeptide repeat [Shewanella amazonensis SB2B]
MPDLSDGELYYDTRFEQLDMANACFRDMEFEDCVFSDCDFSAARFQHCRFNQCRFERCNLSLVVFAASRLFGVSFVESKLIGVDWTRADWPDFHRDFELAFQRCILNDSSFYGLTMKQLMMAECRVQEVDFRHSNFSGASLTHCDFSGSLFVQTNLSRADFSGSEGFNINVLENTLKGATFSRFDALSLLESLGIELVD